MSASTAIGMVSESLRNLLLSKMQFYPLPGVTILAPDESSTGSSNRINLFLYRVQENPAFKNMDWQMKSGSADTLKPPPLSLNLYYLMTSYAANDMETGNSAAHAILGEAMRVFHENPIVPKEYLVEGLQDARERIQIIPNNLNIDELAQVWSTFTQPYRLSVLYQITVVQIDSPDREHRKAPRVRQVGVPMVRAPFNPPYVERIEPICGLENVSTVVTFHGQNLIGWRAYVWVMGKPLPDGEGQELVEDRFEVTLPAGLSPGFHELRVDISHLFRRTFFFEVTQEPSPPTTGMTA